MKVLRYIFVLLLHLFLCLNVFSAQSSVSELLRSVQNTKTVSEAISIYSQIITYYHLNPTDYSIYDKAFKEGGDLCFRNQRFIEALEFYTLDVEAARKCGNMHNYAASLENIGTIYAYLHDYRRAAFYYDRAYKIAVESENNELAYFTLFDKMVNACNADNVTAAKEYYEKLKQTSLPKSKLDEFYLLLGKGLIAEKEKRYPDAIQDFKKTVRFIYDEGIDSIYSEPILLELGKCFFEEGLYDSALCYLQKSEDYALRHNMSVYLADTYMEIQKVHTKMGNHAEAEKYEEKYHQLFNDIYNSERIQEAQNLLFESESKAHKEEIDSLSNLIEKQLSVIIAFFFFIVGLAVLLIIIRKQKNHQIESYKLLIEKNRELISKNEQSKELREKYLQAISDKSHETPKLEVDSIRVNASYSLGSLQTEKLLEKITLVMENPQLVFDSDFSFDVLCREVGSNSKYVSIVLNNAYKKNFKTLLNERRVQEATARLSKEECTIQDLAINLGYSNATSFIVAFKKIIGMTPAVYRKLIKKDVY